MARPKRHTVADSEAQVLPGFLLSAELQPGLAKTPQVYELIRRAIVSLDLPPGAAIHEKLICERLEISRTPLREALLQLATENLVRVAPNSGTFVSPIDLPGLFDGQLVRDALETRVVQYAARKADKAFLQTLDGNMDAQRTFAEASDFAGFYDADEAMHQTICEFGASPRVWRLVHGAKAQLDRVRRLAMPEPNHLDIVLSEHAEIARGLRNRDPDAARRAMKAHLGRVFQAIRHLLVERREYFAPDSRGVFEAFASLYERDSSM